MNHEELNEGKPIRQSVNMYDFDGVVSIGVKPMRASDVIVSGRCRDESAYVRGKLMELGITNAVYHNPLTLSERGDHTEYARKCSGVHKANVIATFKKWNIKVDTFFEDDELQARIIKSYHPEVLIVLLKHDLVEK